MHLAREVFQITTAECALIFFPDGAPAYLTRRFDVIPDGGKVPQEDFAQIAGKSEEKGGPNYKYDFSYEELGELMREFVKAYKIEADRFFRIVLFNYLVCNGDAHLKNFSLFRSEDYGDYLLTPAYDLVSTKLHLGTERDTALELFKGDYETAGYKINGKHCKDDFVEFGLRLGLGDERIAKVFEEFTDKKLPLMDDLIDRSFLSDVLKSAYKQNVRDRIKRLIYSYQEEEENDRGKARR